MSWRRTLGQLTDRHGMCWHQFTWWRDCLWQAPQPGFRHRGANSWMDAEMREFPKIEVGKRIKDDGKNVVQMAGCGNWDAWGRKTILIEF